MTPLQHWRRLRRRWLASMLLIPLPWLVLANLPEFRELPPIPLFIAGLLLLAPGLRLFRNYKLALWAMSAPDDAEQAWAHLTRAQARGLLGAALPALWAALLSPLGLEGPAGLLLVLGSLLAALIYRPPVQLLRG